MPRASARAALILALCAWAAPSSAAAVATGSEAAITTASEGGISDSLPRSDAPAPSLPVPRPADWETLSTGLPEEARFRPIVGFRYNRVDGPAPTLGAAFQTARGSAPLIFAQGTYAFSRERPLFEAGFEEPVGDRPWLRFGASGYRRTASEDTWIVEEAENTIFALLARTDYRDYYESAGGYGYVELNPGSDVGIRGAFRLESERSLTNHARVSLTGKHHRFRPNPPIQEGDDRTLLLHLRIGPSELTPLGGTHGELNYERSGDPFGGDFEYGRFLAIARNRIRLSPAENFRMRLFVGTTRSGALPVQKVWHLGGIGTLRGHDFKALSGDQFFLANAEMSRRVRKNLHGFAFLDYGSAWFGTGNLGRQKPEPDAGAGIRIGEGAVAVTVAKNLRSEDSKFRVGVRLGERF